MVAPPGKGASRPALHEPGAAPSSRRRKCTQPTAHRQDDEWLGSVHMWEGGQESGQGKTRRRGGMAGDQL